MTERLIRESESMKHGFITHNLSAGENREDIVGDFFKSHLPKTFGINTGLIMSKGNIFSNQADLVIYDQLYNSPLYPGSTNKLFPVESVYAMIEVKTNLNLEAIKDSIKKCMRFKRLERNYSTVPLGQRVTDSLFILWAFSGPENETIKSNVLKEMEGIPIEFQPDFIVIPDRILVSAGTYRMLSHFGEEGSPYRERIKRSYPNRSYEEIFSPYSFMDLGVNALLTFIIWLTSWLKAAGPRTAPLEKYLGLNKEFGRKF